MPIKRQFIPTSWEQQISQRLGDIGRRLVALERKKGVVNIRQVFLFFAQDSSLAFTWQDNTTGVTFRFVYQDVDTAKVLVYVNGTYVVVPFTVNNGDRVLVTASSVPTQGLGVTITEDIGETTGGGTGGGGSPS